MAPVYCLCLVRAFLQIRNVCLGLCGWPYRWWYSSSACLGSWAWWYSPCTPIAIPGRSDTFRKSTRSYRSTWATSSSFCRASWDSCWPVCSTADSGKSNRVAARYDDDNALIRLSLTCSIFVSNLNSLSTVAWEDFVSQIPIFKGISEKKQLWCIKSISECT